MKYLLAILICGFVGCKDKPTPDISQVVQVTHGDNSPAIYNRDGNSGVKLRINGIAFGDEFLAVFQSYGHHSIVWTDAERVIYVDGHIKLYNGKNFDECKHSFMSIRSRDMGDQGLICIQCGKTGLQIHEN